MLMNNEIILKIDEIINILDSSREIDELKSLKKKLYSHKELMKKIEDVKNSDSYSDSYVLLKKEILSDTSFSKYKEIEREINMLISEINMKLNSLVKEQK